tara:strand:- start:22 stop:249 length:228 start_codon:yes stop_codon:yes gene_type:complete
LETLGQVSDSFVWLETPEKAWDLFLLNVWIEGFVWSETPKKAWDSFGRKHRKKHRIRLVGNTEKSMGFFFIECLD